MNSSARGSPEKTAPQLSGAARPVMARSVYPRRGGVHEPDSTSRRLDSATRSFMEGSFGHDFSDVRVHTDESAADAAQALHARAYTVDRDVVFGAGQYAPQGSGGRKLIAHELAHVVQQKQGGSTGASEVRADSAASRVMQGVKVSSRELGAASPGGIQCQPDDAKESTGEPAPKLEFKPITLPLDLLTAQLPQLQAPTLPGVRPASPIFQVPELSLGSGAASGSLSPTTLPNLRSPLTSLPPMGALPAPGPLAPAAQPAGLAPRAATSAAILDLPSRIGVTDFGALSLGLRFGLPLPARPLPGTPPDRRPQAGQIPGAGPSALSVSDYQFELLDMHLTGKVPHGFRRV